MLRSRGGSSLPAAAAAAIVSDGHETSYSGTTFENDDVENFVPGGSTTGKCSVPTMIMDHDLLLVPTEKDSNGKHQRGRGSKTTMSSMLSRLLIFFKKKKKKRPPIPIIVTTIVCYLVVSMYRFHILMDKNLSLGLYQLHKQRRVEECPSLPHRLQNHGGFVDKPLSMTHEQFMAQLPLMSKPRFGTMGDSILMCHHKDHTTSSSRTSPTCYGVAKIYKSKTVYEHTKRCSMMLAEEDFVPNLLYYNDTTQTLVEEDRGQLTMMNAAIPLDFDQQLRRMVCRLSTKYRIVHRDLYYPNFVIDPSTGYISLIDFGDAFVAASQTLTSPKSATESATTEFMSFWRNNENWNRRNLINLFNIWLHSYDEQQYVERFIEMTIPHIYGNRQWRPKVPRTSSRYEIMRNVDNM